MNISIIVALVAFIFGFFFAIFTAIFFIILAKYEHHRNDPKKHNRGTGFDVPKSSEPE
tara:strand:+ start:310 stop:483 length:174 start_codon:yes stop_codon:yes gene_type:complete